MNHFLFVYGTLKRGYGNHRLIERARFISEDSILGKLWSGFFYPFVKKGDGIVQGELYEVNEDQLRRCDMLEGHPQLYKREQVKTASGKDAWVYFYNGHPSGELLLNGVWEQRQHPLHGVEE